MRKLKDALDEVIVRETAGTKRIRQAIEDLKGTIARAREGLIALGVLLSEKGLEALAKYAEKKAKR